MASDNAKFVDAANIAQEIKAQIRTGSAWDDLTPAASEALDQISTAIARMAVGDGEHWDAIVGYAQATRPTTAEPAPTLDIERGIRSLVREIPQRNGNA